LVTYASAAITSPRSLPSTSRSKIETQIVNAVSIANSAGRSRRARRIQNCFMSTVEVRSFSAISSSVIR
jgi:hypothetical protein